MENHLFCFENNDHNSFELKLKQNAQPGSITNLIEDAEDGFRVKLKMDQFSYELVAYLRMIHRTSFSKKYKVDI